MGYTHYWYVRRDADGGAWRQALVEVAKIVEASPVPLAWWDGTGQPEIGEGGVRFNGLGEQAHETFVLLADPAMMARSFSSARPRTRSTTSW
jgi:hypothetical protein